MEVQGFNVNVTSENPARLIDFYADVVGLTKRPEISPGAFMAGGAGFLIDGHSETVGRAKDPTRVLLTFTVADAAAEQARLEGAGVTFIRPATREPWGGVVATFLDPDGNICQLNQFPQR